jgi:hypothetical protein
MPRVRRAGQRHLTPLVGREEELAMLMRRWERARKGDGQLVLIVAARGKLGPCSTPGGRLRWVESHRVWPSALAHGPAPLRGGLPRFSRSRSRTTVFDDHCPPVALLMPRRFSSAAIWRAEGRWATSVRIGFMRAASSCLLGFFDDHCPPVALLMPRRFSSAAIWRAEGRWATSVRIGFMRAASSCLLGL